MSYTSIRVVNKTQFTLRVAKDVSYGSDWKDTLSPDTDIPQGEGIIVAKIGDPGVAESNHWGWLYFDAVFPATSHTFPLQLFYGESHRGPANASFGPRSRSTSDNPMPLGKWDNVETKLEDAKTYVFTLKD